MDEYRLQNTNDSLPVGDGGNIVVDGSMLLVSIIIVIVMHTAMDQHT